MAFSGIIYDMKINPRLKKIILVAIVILVIIAGIILAARFILPKIRSSRQQYIQNILEVADSYVLQGFANSQEPKYYDYAIEQYHNILRLDPKNKAALQRLAGVYTQKKEYEKADKIYRILVSNYPRNGEVQAGMGFHYLIRGMKNEALNRANMAISYDPQNNKGYMLKAFFYEQEGDLPGAIAAYKKAIVNVKTPHGATQNSIIYFGLGRLYTKAGLYFEAVQQFEKVIRIWPKYTDGYLELASFYDRVGLIDKEISVLNSLLSFNKKDARAYALLGLAYLNKNGLEASYAHFKKAKSLGADVKDDFLENLNKAIQKGKEAPEPKKKE